MSYIHEALKKAQVERDLGKGFPIGIPVPHRKKPFFTAKRSLLLAACGLTVLLAFAGYSWWDRKAEKPDGVPSRAVKTSKDLGTAPTGTKGLAKDSPKGQDNRPAYSQKVPRGIPEPREASVKALSQMAAVSKAVSREEIAAGYQKARALHRDGRLPEAGLWYEKVIAMDPGHVEALNNRGVLYLHEKNYPAARKCFEKAIRLKPDYVDPYYNLACVSAAGGQLEQGLRYLEKAVSMDPRAREWAGNDPDLDPLRELQRFNEIVR